MLGFAKSGVFATFLAVVAPGLSAAPITFEYTSTIDLSQAGGDASSEFEITYEFDSDATGTILGSFNRFPVNFGTAKIGTDQISFVGGSINLQNLESSLYRFEVTDPFSISGTVLGRDVAFFAFQIGKFLDSFPQDSLVTDPIKLEGGSTVNTIGLIGASTDPTNTSNYSVGDVSPVPLPASLPFLLAGLCGLTLMRTRKIGQKPAKERRRYRQETPT